MPSHCAMFFNTKTEVKKEKRQRKLTNQSEYGLFASPPRHPTKKRLRAALLGPVSGCFAFFVLKQPMLRIGKRTKNAKPRRGGGLRRHSCFKNKHKSTHAHNTSRNSRKVKFLWVSPSFYFFNVVIPLRFEIWIYFYNPLY